MTASGSGPARPGSARAYAHLLRWLGPWTPDARVPDGVRRESITVEGDRPFEAWVYRPAAREPAGAYLVAPGLHYAGPADVRLDRFCRILSGAGLVVLAPFLPDYTALRVGEGVIGDLQRAFEALRAAGGVPAGVAPGVFSISFGSLPALRLAASDPRVGALVLFGGYADFGAAIRFCLGAEGRERPRDPLNQPVVFLNLLDELDGVPADPEARSAVVDAWMRYVRATWGKPEMKAPSRYRPIAEALSSELADPAARDLFLLGCGLREGAYEACERALARQAERRPFLDPRPHLGGIRCPVAIVHGLDDDVIPATQASELAAIMPPAAPVQVHVTGLYAHTGQSALRSLPAAAREAITLLRVLAALVAGGTRQRR